MPPIPATLASLLALALACAVSLRAEPGMPFTDAPVWLVRDGVFNGKIFIGAQAPAAERESAEYLAEWIRRVTGATATIAVENAGRTEPGIYVGDTLRARSAGIITPKTPSREGFAWEPRRNGRIVFIVGESPLATRHATGRFLREKLGVEFLVPGDFGADWKPLRDVAAPAAREAFAPAFAWRQLSGLNTPAEREWAKNGGLGELPAMNHALYSIFDQKAFEENPAMFPMRGGRRVGPSGRGGYEPQPNLANPASAEHAALRANEFFRRNPDAPAFSLSINDNMTWDESPESKAALGTGKFFRNRPDYSDYVFGFMNRTAIALRRLETKDERLRSQHEDDLRATAGFRLQNAKVAPSPAKGGNDSANPSSFVLRPSSNLAPASDGVSRRLTAYAYYHCENTPSFRLEPEVFPILTADRSEWRDPAFAAEDAQLMRRWADTGVNAFGIYDYYYGRHMAVPRIFHQAQSESVRHAAKCGAKLFYAELDPDWGFDGPKAWLATRLAWQADADTESLLNSYYTRAYGPAAAHMRKFFELAESRWANRPQPPRWIRFFLEESVAELFPSAVCADMRAALDAAERAFPPASDRTLNDDTGPRERRHLRVRAVSVSFTKTETFVAAYEAVKRLAALPDATDAAGARNISDALAAYRKAEMRHRASVARWNACALNPGTPCNPDIFRHTDAYATAAAKCGAVFHNLPAGSPVPAEAAQALADAPGAGVETPVSECFEAESFRAAAPGSWAARRGLTIPKAPWNANLFEAEHTRFGHSEQRAASGKGSLLIAGGDLAKLSRHFPVAAGDLIAAKLKHSGKIIPGTHVALCIRFVDASGRDLPGRTDSLALPGSDDGWRTLAAFASAPPEASVAEVQLRVMNQDAGDALWVDDLTVRVRRAPCGENGE